MNEERERAERAHEYFMETEQDAAAYMAWILVAKQSREYAERVLNTPLA